MEAHKSLVSTMNLSALNTLSRFFCACLFCLLTHVSNASAQQQSTPLRFQHFGAEDGLPQITVSLTMQDRFGYMWFGTQDGLARYDGYSFTVFRHNPQDAATLSSSTIRVLLEDQRHGDRGGDLWIGTGGSGLNRLDRSTGNITRYEHNPADPASLSHYEVWSLLEDRSGVLWVGTSGGLNRFDRATGTFTRYQSDETDAASLSDNVVLSLLEDHTGRFWVGTGKGLNSLDRTTGKFTRYLHNPADPKSLSSNNFVKTLLEDRDGVLWVSTQEGLNRFDRATETFTRYLHNPADPKSLINNGVMTLLEDRRYSNRGGNLWIGTQEGLNHFDRATGIFTRHLHTHTDPSSLSNDKILSLFEDRSGGLWVGTASGINRFDRTADKFVRHQHNPFNAASLNNNNVWAILEDHLGALWLGTSGGLNYFDRTTGKFMHYLHNSADKNSLSDNEIWSLLEDHSGKIWVGTRSGLNRFDRSTGKFIRYYHNPTDTTSLSNNGVFSLLEDRVGRLWVGTGGGVNRFDPATNTFTQYRHNPADPKSVSGRVVTSFFEDRSGTLWVGVRGGLDRFDPTTDTFEHFRHNPADPKSLSHNLVSSLYEDRSGAFWVGTYGGGLNRFDRATRTFTAFREKDGLPNDTVYGILEDEHGNLWLSTNKGLSKFNPQKQTFTNYDKRDGLQDNEFCSGASHRGKSGRMYFGGTIGFNEFFPDSVSANLTPPPVLITMFKKFNRPVVLDSAMEVKKVITLSHSDNDIGFEFVTLSFSIPERNLYRYKLEGYDKDWSSAGTERKAIYTNLDPGEYTFRVRGSNSDGVWNMEGASVQVIILPPWWARWWARTIFALCAIGSLYQTYHWRINALARQNARLEQQVRERTAELHDATIEITHQMETLTEQATEIQIVNSALLDINVKLEDTNKELTILSDEKDEFMGIAAHDLRNPIGSIRSLAILLEEAHNLAPEKIQSIGSMVRKSSDTMLTLIGNLLNLNALERGAAYSIPEEFDVFLLVSDIVSDYEIRASAKHITLHCTKNAAKTSVYADRTACLQIFDNIISNAVKYSPHGRQIWVSTEVGAQGIVRVVVKDEGTGFSEEDKRRLFGKFARLSTIPTGGEQRTGLGLSIVKQLVERQNGRVWCESELGNGATFIVELPVSSSESV